MSINIVNGGSTGGGGFLKPEEFTSAVMGIFEAKKAIQSRFNDERTGQPKFEAVGDYTFFLSDAEVKAGKPSIIKEDAVFSSGVLAKVLIENIGNVMVGTLEKTKGAAGKQGYWKIQPTSQANLDKAVAYLEAREAQKEKDREALPDFLKKDATSDLPF